MFAYPKALGGIALLVAALLFGREVNGAKAWFEFGSLRVQPVEFAKIATALAQRDERIFATRSQPRRVHHSEGRRGDLHSALHHHPANDCGSGIVPGSFLFINSTARELSKWLCIPGHC